MTIDVLADEAVEELRQKLGLSDSRRPSPGDGDTEASDRAAPAPRRPLPRQPRALAIALTRRYAGPVADPVLHRLARTLAPTVSAMVAQRLMGRLEPDVRRLTADVELMKAEVAALAATDRGAMTSSVNRTKRRLDDLTHRLNQLEGKSASG
jgi:hypothetical protein